MPPKPRVLTCSYIEGGRRCRRKGDGNPPLCESHRVVLEAEAGRAPSPGARIADVISRAMRGHKIKDEDLVGSIEDFVGMFSRQPGDPPHNPVQAARARAADFLRRAQQAQRGGQPPDGFSNPPRPHHRAPPPQPPRPTGPDPRVVLGFAVGQKLTVDEIKKRHRELARRHHPDRGGNVETMSRINHAVDQLLASLG